VPRARFDKRELGFAEGFGSGELHGRRPRQEDVQGIGFRVSGLGFRVWTCDTGADNRRQEHVCDERRDRNLSTNPQHRSSDVADGRPCTPGIRSNYSDTSKDLPKVLRKSTVSGLGFRV